jgi:DNA-binding PadR family transcriptional regulator
MVVKRPVYPARPMSEPSRPRSPLWLVVLASLVEEPMHPYRMQVLIKERGKDLIANVAQRNSIYQAIDGLHRAGLIVVHGTERDVNRPERTVYAITPEGRKTLHAWLHTMIAEPAREFPDFPAALSFAMMLEPAELRAQLEARAASLEARLAALAAPAPVSLPRLFLLETEYLATITRAELEWVRRVIADLKSKKLTWSEAWLRKIAAQLGAAQLSAASPSPSPLPPARRSTRRRPRP